MLTRLPPTMQFAALPAVVMLVLVAVLYAATRWLVTSELQDDSAMRVEQRAALLADRLSATVTVRVREVEQLARSSALRDVAAAAAMGRELEWLKERSGAYTWIGVVRADGQVASATAGGADAPLPPVGAGRAPATGEASFAQLPGRFIPSGGAPAAVAEIVVPVIDSAGRPAARLVARLGADWFAALGNRTVTPEERELQGLSWHVLGTDGRSLTGPLPFALPPAAERDGPAVRVVSTGAGDQFVAARRVALPGPAADAHWLAVVAQDVATADEPARQFDRTLGVFAIATVLLFALLGYLAARRAIRPFERLFDVARRRFEAAGGHRAMPYSDYLEVLGDELSAALPANRNGEGEGDLLLRLAHDARQLKRVIDHLPMGVAISSSDFRVQYVNQTYTRMLGWTIDEVRNRRTAEFLFEGEERTRFVRQFDQMANPPGEMAARFDAVRADGSRLPVQWHMVPLFDRHERFDGVVTVVHDISGEQRARSRADALAGRLQVFADAAVDYAFVMLDGAGQVLAWSRGAEVLTGLPAAQSLGRPFETLLGEGTDAARRSQALLRAARTDGQAPVDAPFATTRGTTFFGHGTLYWLPTPEGDAGYALILSDTTAEQEASRRVSESEGRLTAVISSASDAIVSTDIAGTVLLFNPAAERTFQVAAADMIGQPLDRLLPALAQAAHKGHLGRFAASRVTRRAMGAGQVQGVRTDGRSIELEASISQAVVAGQTVLTAILRDVTERARADRALVQYQEQLAGLAQRLLAQEKETTQRLAQALHDDLGQTLAALRLIYDAAQHKLPPGEAPQPWLGRIDRLIGDANRQVRRVLTDLRPALLDEQGLLAALDNELKQRTTTHEGVVLRLDLQVPPGVRWPADVEYAAFMVAREAVNNALRHAQPAEVVLTLAGDRARLALSVRDDGQGHENMQGIVRPGHLGLVGMRERALAIGARLDIDSVPGEGTCVALSWAEGAG